MTSTRTPWCGSPGTNAEGLPRPLPTVTSGAPGSASSAAVAGNVGDREGDVVKALAVFGEVGGDRAGVVERLDELDEDGPGVEVGEAHVRRLDHLGAGDLEPEPAGEVLERALGVGDRDRDVVEPLQRRHSGPLRARRSSPRQRLATADDWAWWSFISARPVERVVEAVARGARGRRRAARC